MVCNLSDGFKEGATYLGGLHGGALEVFLELKSAGTIVATYIHT